MLLRPIIALAAMFVLTACAGSTLMTTADYNELRGSPPDAVIKYGEAALQFGQLRVPERGQAPYPVVMVIHGGCWLSQYDLTGTEALSAALTEAGVATWNVEYRRVGDEGGGWPGTFDDVAMAADHLRRIAADYPIDPGRVVAVGHSAGGHLALWLAARHKLPAGAPGTGGEPLALGGVVSLAGVTDLVSAAQENLCGDAVQRLMGGMPGKWPERYASASPTGLLPLGVPQVLVNGVKDPIVPPKYADSHAVAAKFQGDDARYVGIAGAGHFELVAPETPAWRQVEAAVLDLVATLEPQ